MFHASISRLSTAVALAALLVQPALAATSITINFGGLTTVYPGQSYTVTVTFLSNGIATDPSSKSVTYQHPSGTQDSTSQFTKVSTGIYRQTATMSTDAVSGQRTYYVTGTISGTYTTASASFSVACPSLSATVETDKATYLLGDTVKTTVRYYKDGAPADPLSQTVTVLLPTGSASTLSMTKSSTGVYTSSGVASVTAGQRTTTAQATISGSQCSVQATGTYNVVTSLSSPTPTPVPTPTPAPSFGAPAVALQARLALLSSTATSMTIQHQGGDTLTLGRILLYVDGQSEGPANLLFMLEDQSGQRTVFSVPPDYTWSTGQTLTLGSGAGAIQAGSQITLKDSQSGGIIASMAAYPATPTPTPAPTATGSPCALSTSLSSDSAQVKRAEAPSLTTILAANANPFSMTSSQMELLGMARLTLTLTNSGDETCSSTRVSSQTIPADSGVVAWERAYVDVPTKGSAKVTGLFQATTDGAYTVTATAARGLASANGAITIVVGTPQTPTLSGCDGQPQGAKRCSGNFVQQCSADNVWRSVEECPYGCGAGTCKTPPPTSTPAAAGAPSTPTPAKVGVDINVSGLPKTTPGFEVLPAVAALGVLGLALRKRR